MGTLGWGEEYDVLVEGSGGGGVTGAYTAAREGLDVLFSHLAVLDMARRC